MGRQALHAAWTASFCSPAGGRTFRVVQGSFWPPQADLKAKIGEGRVPASKSKGSPPLQMSSLRREG